MPAEIELADDITLADLNELISNNKHLIKDVRLS